MEKNNLPELSELHMTPEKAFEYDKFLTLINQSPHEKWIKKHPMYGNKYLPIDKVEYLLKRIFQQYKIEVLREGIMLNAAYVTVRVHYLHPQLQQWMFHDGVGAKSFQLDSGSAASDLRNIKAEAVMLALPIAKTMAIKDACDHLGKLFGGDLNRKDTLRFKGGYKENKITDSPEPEEDEIRQQEQEQQSNEEDEDLPL